MSIEWCTDALASQITDVTITYHAAQRWIERVDPSLDIVGAYAAIKQHEKIIELGISLRATAIKLGSGARLILSGSYVVTVIGRG